MADRVFDILALPENIRSLINIGTATSKRIRLIQHAPEISERLKSLGFDIYNAQLYLQLEELNLLLEKVDNVEYRILAAKHTKKLSDLNTEAEQTLNKCFDGAEVRKLQLGIFAEDINEILKRYGRALSDFQAFMSALYIQQQLKSSKDSDNLLLERNRFAVYRRYETATDFYLDHTGCVRRAKGELVGSRDGPPQERIAMEETKGWYAKHTAAGIPTWSPSVVLICRSTAYVWQSGRDAQFPADCDPCSVPSILQDLLTKHSYGL
ncbi:hypothetical protein KCU91_g9408, partial [Aureobasidium melanogenum]